ncbi:MAG: DUF1573 domain-containing protein [Cyclobacteriaceae bacterium]|nr:DUF1573 domain-containing protein [Cyclobacteriaceae bacterium]
MKKLFLLATFILGIAVMTNAQVNVASGDPTAMAKFKWVETTHDFGKIAQGKPVSTEFTFTNTGSTPLVISNVKGSCGCTVTEYTKDAIAPGKTGNVKATFNAAAVGAFNKSIRVTANVEGGSETLMIKGEVTN